MPVLVLALLRGGGNVWSIWKGLGLATTRYPGQAKKCDPAAGCCRDEWGRHLVQPPNFVGPRVSMSTAILASFVPVLLALGTRLQPFLRRNGPKTRHAAGGRPQRRRHRRSHARCWRRLPKLGERPAPGAQGLCEPPWGAAAEPRRCGRGGFAIGRFYSKFPEKRPKTVGYSASRWREPRCYATRKCGASC